MPPLPGTGMMIVQEHTQRDAAARAKPHAPLEWLNLDFALKRGHGRMSKHGPEAQCLALTELDS